MTISGTTPNGGNIALTPPDAGTVAPAAAANPAAAIHMLDAAAQIRQGNPADPLSALLPAPSIAPGAARRLTSSAAWRNWGRRMWPATSMR